MMSLAGKKIVLGVSGGIAAYKTPELVRRLRERGADVRVAMTEAAKAFITPLSLQAVSGYPVSDSLLDPAAEAAMGHIELGKWADLVILAPATADLIARVAAGMANDLVSTICLATPEPAGRTERTPLKIFLCELKEAKMPSARLLGDVIACQRGLLCLAAK